MLFRSVGVEKSFLIHSPLVEKIEITRRAKVRRKNLSFLRERSGKSARLTNKAFDRAAVNNPEAAAVEEEVVVSKPVTDAQPTEETVVETATTESTETSEAPASETAE